MEIGLLEQIEIQKYFQLEQRIEKKKKAIGNLREAFYSQTMASHVSDDGMQIVSIGFPVESRVISFIDTEVQMKYCLKRLRKKLYYFKQYLQRLDHKERNYLQNKYDRTCELPSKMTEADEQVYEYIQEVEEAIGHMYGWPLEKSPAEVGAMDSLLAMTELLGV